MTTPDRPHPADRRPLISVPVTVVIVAAALLTLAALAGCGVTEDVAGPTTSSTPGTDGSTTEPGSTSEPSTTSTTDFTPSTTEPDPDPTPTTGGVPDPGDREFCAIAAELQDLDDELGDAIEEGQVERFKDGYRRYVDVMERAEESAPDEVVDELGIMVDVLHDLQGKVDAARTTDDLKAVGDDPSVEGADDAFDAVQSYTENNCPDTD